VARANLELLFFSNSRAFMKIGGLRVDTEEVQGHFCKVAGIKEFPNLIYNEKNSVDRVHSAVDHR
jgi:uncharacterized protein YunC (DUF1805 family)